MDDLRKSARNFHDWQPRAGEQFRCIWSGDDFPFTPGKTYTAEQLGDAVVVFDDGGTAWGQIGYAGFVPEQAAALSEAQATIARLEDAARQFGRCAGFTDEEITTILAKTDAALSPREGEG